MMLSTRDNDSGDTDSKSNKRYDGSDIIDERNPAESKRHDAKHKRSDGKC